MSERFQRRAHAVLVPAGDGAVRHPWPTDAERTAAKQVTVRLSYDEAVVLSDMLSRWERDGAQVMTGPRKPIRLA
jgi:hypothetical protein